MQTEKILIPCTVTEGMFGNECAVEIKLPNDEAISLFADRSLIQTRGSKTYLEVNLIDSEDGGRQAVLLPSESFEKGTRWLRVATGDLVAA